MPGEKVSSHEDQPPRATPVSEVAVRAALDQVIGGKTTDQAKYDSYVQRLEISRPHFKHAVERLVAIRCLGPMGEQVNDNSYVGGAFIYFAAVQHEARLQGIRTPVVTLDDLTGAFTLQAARIGQLEVLNNATDFFKRYMGSVDRETFYDISQSGVEYTERIYQDADRDAEAQALIFADDAEQNQKLVYDFADLATTACAYQIQYFCSTEKDFVRVMDDHWWQDVAPVISFSQAMGAADAASLVEASYIRTGFERR